jgi:hypothetical protein
MEMIFNVDCTFPIYVDVSFRNSLRRAGNKLKK